MAAFDGEDVYFSADVEADGPVPGPFSILSFGLAVAGSFDGTRFRRVDPTATTFYAELRPISDEYDPAALAVSGLDRGRLIADGEEPGRAMTRAAVWIREVGGGGRPVLAAYPASFDWMWLYWYFVRFARGGSPFGFSGCFDLKTAYVAVAGVRYGEAVKRRMPRELLSRRRHTHHALDDAIEQADMLANWWEWRAGRVGPPGDR